MEHINNKVYKNNLLSLLKGFLSIKALVYEFKDYKIITLKNRL